MAQAMTAASRQASFSFWIDLMAHLLAKVLLEQAGNFVDRCEATAIVRRLGMPLHAIEDYLDWLENTAEQSPQPRHSSADPDFQSLTEQLEARLLNRPDRGSAA